MSCILPWRRTDLSTLPAIYSKQSLPDKLSAFRPYTRLPMPRRLGRLSIWLGHDGSLVSMVHETECPVSKAAMRCSLPAIKKASPSESEGYDTWLSGALLLLASNAVYVFELVAPAKVNLYLILVGKRPDGYHELETCLHALDLADELGVR